MTSLDQLMDTRRVAMARTEKGHRFNGSCTVCYMYYGKEDAARENKHYGPCHYFMKNIVERPSSMLNYIPWSRWGEGPKRYAEGWAFIDYLVQRSPYARVFLEKDTDFGLMHGFEVDVDAPSSLLVGGLIAARMPDEFPNMTENFSYLVKKHKMSEHLAFLLCMAVEDAGPIQPVVSGHRNSSSMGLCTPILSSFVSQIDHERPMVPRWVAFL